MQTATATQTEHRHDAMHYVTTGEHRCTCGWTPTTPHERLQRRAVGTHAAAARRH